MKQIKIVGGRIQKQSMSLDRGGIKCDVKPNLRVRREVAGGGGWTVVGDGCRMVARWLLEMAAGRWADI